MLIPDSYELKQMRINAGLTQQQLAKHAGITQGMIARIETGDVDPRLSTMKKIVSAIEDAERESKKAKDVMTSPVKSISSGSIVDEAIDIMKEYSISQLPVMKMGTPVGLLSERILMKQVQGSKQPSRLTRTGVDKVMNEAPPIVNKTTALRAIFPLLEYNPCVLVMEKAKIVGIITRADILGLV